MQQVNMIYLLIKKTSCQEKRTIKTNLTGQIHKTVTRLLTLLPLVPAEFGQKVEQWKFTAGILHHWGGQVLSGFTDEFVDQLEKVDLAAVQLMLAE
jgi:hypothetical protein